METEIANLTTAVSQLSVKVGLMQKKQEASAQDLLLLRQKIDDQTGKIDQLLQKFK